MKILFSNAPQSIESPWGGGNVLLYHLHEHLIKNGHEVVFNLENDVDVCYITDPRNSDHIYDWAEEKGIPIVQRVGDLGTHNKPELLKKIQDKQSLVETYVFPSSWAKSYAKENGIATSKAVVLPNVADRSFTKKKLKIVTHHWSDNPRKGADTYTRLVRDLDYLNVEFTYIGRMCFNTEGGKNFKHVQPLTKQELNKELRKHDFYLTASEAEAGANHVLEAIACNLPVFYSTQGGSIPEYCRGRGIAYSSYDELRSFLEPKHSLSATCEAYLQVFEDARSSYSG